MVPHRIDPDYEGAATAVREFHQRSQRAIDRALSAHGASFAQAKILQTIHGRTLTRSTDLAQLHGLSPRTVTEAIDGLERAGLVLRVPDASDRRAKTLSLTPLGTATAIATEKVRQGFVETLFSALDQRERDTLADLLNRLSDRLAAM